MGLCDVIPGSSNVESSLRAPQVRMKPKRHERELHEAQSHVHTGVNVVS